MEVNIRVKVNVSVWGLALGFECDDLKLETRLNDVLNSV